MKIKRYFGVAFNEEQLKKLLEKARQEEPLDEPIVEVGENIHSVYVTTGVIGWLLHKIRGSKKRRAG